eukprot:344975-Pleurochrysis_carterae.AAC.3
MIVCGARVVRGAGLAVRNDIQYAPLTPGSGRVRQLKTYRCLLLRAHTTHARCPHGTARRLPSCEIEPETSAHSRRARAKMIHK